jgi:hypothetical protein
MKRFAMLAAVLMLGAAACDDDDPPTNQNPNTGPIVFSQNLSAANETPPITGTEAGCTGTSTITFNVPRDSATGAVTGSGTVDFAYTVTNCPAGTVIRAAHIHRGAAGVAGGIEVDTGLTPANAVTLPSGSITATQRAITQALATEIVGAPQGFYFNAHSNNNTGGVVRGQLVRQP